MKTPNKFKALTVILSFVGMSLLLAGCFGNQNALQQKSLDALQGWEEQTSYSTTGKVEVDYNNADTAENILEASSWHWKGNTDQSSNSHVYELTLRNSAESILPLVYQDERWLTPWMDHEQEEEVWFQFENKPSALDILKQPDPMTQVLTRWIEQIDPDIIQETEGNKLTLEIHDEALPPFVEQWKESLDSLGEPFSTLHGVIHSDAQAAESSGTGTVTLSLNEDDQLTEYSVAFDSDAVHVEWSQQRSSVLENETDLVLSDDAIIIPFDSMIEKVAEIQTVQTPEEVDLEQTIALENTYSYPDGSDAAKINALLISHMEAIINEDQDAHDPLFRRPTFAENHKQFIETERKFRFTHIEDLNFKNFNDAVRVGVVYDFADPGDIAITSSALWYTLNKNENGEWKIDSIK